MKKWLLNSALLAACSSLATAATVTIEPVFSASGSAFDSLPTNRFGVLSTPGDTTGVTHLVTGTFDLVGTEANAWIGADYVGINSNATTPETLETGIVAFDLDAMPSVPEGAVSSGIVAVIPRAGSWAQGATTTPATAPLAGASGTADGSMFAIDLSLTNPAVTGSVGYTIADPEYAILAPFTLSDGTTAYSFKEGWLELTGPGTYSGVLLTGQPANFDQMAYIVTVSGVADSDSDGTPDLTDTDNLWYAPYWAGENGLIVSEWFGAFWSVGNDVIYHEDLGWLYSTESDGWLVAYAYDSLGWIAVHEGQYPYIYAYGVPTVDQQGQEGSWVYFKTNSGGDAPAWFYFFQGARSTTGEVDGYPGWWSF